MLTVDGETEMSDDEIVHEVARALCSSMFGTDHGTARCCQIGGTDGCCVTDLYENAKAAIVAVRLYDEQKFVGTENE
jgi:hypothetical protein